MSSVTLCVRRHRATQKLPIFHNEYGNMEIYLIHEAYIVSYEQPQSYTGSSYLQGKEAVSLNDKVIDIHMIIMFA